MNKMLVAVIFILAISLSSIVQAFDGRPPQDVLRQLPADKEMLFHQTMRGVWEATANIREQIQRVEAEARAVLTAPKFDEALFLEKKKNLEELHKTAGETMDRAITKLASQFTVRERAILAELSSHKPGLPVLGGPPAPPGFSFPFAFGAHGGRRFSPGPPPR